MKLKAILLSAASAAFLSTATAFAALTFTIEEVGSDVVLTGSGSANLADLTLYTEDFEAEFGGVDPGLGSFLSSSGLVDLYSSVDLVPFGDGETSNHTSGSGLPVGVNIVKMLPLTVALVVPAGYVSGDVIAPSTSLFEDTDLQTLGVDPGTYVWNWGSGANADSVTLTAVPEPSICAALFAVAALGIALGRKRAAH